MKILFAFVLMLSIFCRFTPCVFATGNDINWKNNFGGSGFEQYADVTAVSDGVVAVGNGYFDSFGNGDWLVIPNKGEFVTYDAIMVKYDNNSNVVRKAFLWENHQNIILVALPSEKSL